MPLIDSHAHLDMYPADELTGILEPRTSNLEPRTSVPRPCPSSTRTPISTCTPRTNSPESSNLEPRTSNLVPPYLDHAPHRLARPSRHVPRGRTHRNPRTSNLEPRTSYLRT